jgi:hypothetical protein
MEEHAAVAINVVAGFANISVNGAETGFAVGEITSHRGKLFEANR